MAKPRTPNQKKAYAALKGRLNQYSHMVQTVYDTLNAEAARLALSTGYEGDGEFSWDDYPKTQKRIADLQARFVGDISSVVYAGTSQEWAESNLLQDLLVNKALKSYKAQAHGQRFKMYYQPNSEALKAFQERADHGMNLSDRLWKQSQGYRRELECAIGTAVEKGTSAVTLSKRISKYLTNFDQLKADYKEKYGKVADCHDCEYNSIRLARTEINMSYRTAEQKRWQQLDFVLGYEIKLSGSHPVTDICDELKGRYPKDFVWTGWHPSCMCYSIPILKTEEEFWADDDTPSENAVTDVPEKVHEWLGENAERLGKAAERGTLPYWLRDNPQLLEGMTAKKVEPALREIIGEKNDIHDMFDTSSPESKVRMALHNERVREYKRVRESDEYENVAFDFKTLGLKANHVGHNFDKRGGVYEKHVRDAGYNAGHAVILENELGGAFSERFTEGTWDGKKFEVAGCETGTSNNILHGLSHCASKGETRIAVLDFPKGGFNREVWERTLGRYRGLKNVNNGQYLEFERIICVQEGEIIIDIPFP